MAEYPRLLHTVLDTTTPRQLAEFYRELLGLQYRPGDEPPAGRADRGEGADAGDGGEGEDGGEGADGGDDPDWLVLVDSTGARQLAFQLVDQLTPTTWPTHEVPMQAHVDFTVSSRDELERHRRRAEALGAALLLDRTDDADEPLYVFADLSGHPFCLFVA